MRICVISDVHADARLFGLPRFPEVELAMRFSVEEAIGRGCSAWVFLGDLCDPDSGSSAFRVTRLALECAVRLSRKGIRSIWVAGNHDVIEDGSGETTLSPLRALGSAMGVEVHERPGWTGIGPEQGAVPCLVLPYSATSHHYEPARYAADTWDRATEKCRRVIVLEHMDVEGAMLGEETTDMARGRRLVYPRADVEQLAAERSQELVQLGGHLHMRQRVGGLQIVGAPARFAFGERSNEPSFSVVELPEVA